METPSQLPPNKPAWLQKMEEESWQAELIISGLAIFSSLQLPGLVEWMIEWSIANIAAQFLPFMYLFFTYLGMGSYVLIFIFVGHFVLRALWIGLVGLNSVYPRSINYDSNYYPRHFLEKFEQESPDPNDRIRQLDQLCSILFAGGAQIVMIFIAITIDILILAGLRYVLGYFLESDIADTILYIFAGSLLLFSFFFMLTNSKWMRNRAWVVRWQYPLYKIFGRLTLNIFFRPASQIAMTFQTNVSVKRYTVYVLGGILLVGIAFIIRFVDRDFVALIRPSLLYSNYNNADRLQSKQYASLRTTNDRLLSLELESDQIKGAYMRVFVPILELESTAIDSLCGTFVAPEGLTRQERREAASAFTINCYQRQHRFFVNDSLYRSPDLVRYEHPNQGEEGILVYLPTAGFKPGRNVLRVEKSGGSPESTMRTMQAPFWFEPQR